jgi:peptide methionine sulfoxide reductase msrA/msrB
MKRMALFFIISLLLFAEESKQKNNNTSTSIAPLGGKEILVVESKNCKFCEQFEHDIIEKYHGTIPLRVVQKSDRNKGFKINKIKGTPTIIFIRDGKEVYAYRGYMEEKLFYKALAIHKLGLRSQAFQVAFKGIDDNKSSEEYKKLKDRKGGFFVDKISGDALFDAGDRFNSTSGWLTFSKSIEGAIVQKDSNNSNSKIEKVEIIAKKSGAHLGYLLNDKKKNKKYYSINASILEFIPKDNNISSHKSITPP